MAKPPRISKAEWASKNPPRSGETREQYKQRYEDDTSPTLLESGLSTAGDFGRSAISGVFGGVGSTTRAVGELTGSPTLRRGGADMEALAEEYRKAAVEDPEGFVSKAGQLAGRAGLEIGAAYAGSRAGTSVLRRGAPLVGRFLPSAAKGMRYLSEGLEKGGALRRALSSAVVNAPVDIIQGAGSDSGVILPGRAGAIAENMLFSGAGGALDAGLDARRAAQLRAREAGEEAARMVGPFQASPIPDAYGPFQASPIPDAYGPFQASPIQRLLTAPAETKLLPRPTRVIPMPGRVATPRERGVALMRTDQAATPATGFAEAGEAASQDVLALREQLQNMSEADLQRWMAMNMPGASEEEILQMMTEMLPVRSGKKGTRTGVPLSRGEDQSLRGVRPAMMRPRRGAASAELLSSLTGAGAGGLYGFATGETEEDRLARALAYATAGGGLGFGATRFFGNGATSRAQQGAAIREAGQDVLSQMRRGEKPSATTTQALEEFPENRRPMLDNMNLGAAERFIVEEEIRRVEPTITRPRTEKQLREEAARITGTQSVQDLLDFTPKGPREEARRLAMMNVHKNLRDQITDRLNAIVQSTDANEIQRLSAEVEGFDDFATRLVSKIMKADTEAGRALQSRKYMAAQINNPTYWHIKGSKAKGQFGVLSPAEKAEIDRLINAGDTEKLLQYMAALQKSSKAEQVAQLRSAGLLTAFPGRLRDLISTSANYVSTVAQRYPGMLVDAGLARLASASTGIGAEKFRTVAAPTALEFTEAATGAVKGLEAAAASMGYGKKNLKDWVEHIRTAEIDPDMMRQYDLPSVINIDLFGTGTSAGRTANAIADTYSKGVMRLSGVTDKIIRQAALNGAMVEQAQLGAIRRGLKGQAAQDFVQQALKNPDDEMMLNAISAAEYITFTNDGRLADGIAGAIERIAAAAGRKNAGTGALVRAGARFLIPFRRTPANILSRAIEYTPGTGVISIPRAALNWHRELAKAALAGTTQGTEALANQRKLVDLMTKQATGLGMFTLGAYLYNQGKLTGDFPESPAEQEQWRTEGKQPESILINGQWLPISRISPYGSMMTLAASVLSNAENNPDRSLAGDVLGAAQATSQSVLNQPMLTGPLEALETTVGRSRDGEATAERFLRNMAGSFVPSFLAQAARAEGVQRQPQSLVESITSRIPGMQETAPVRLNIFGEPVRKAGGLLNTMVNPLTGTPDVREQDPLVAELSRAKVNIPAMKRAKGESLEMYQYRQRGAGEFVREDLEALVASEEYRAASLQEKQRLIKQTYSKARRDFSAYLKENFSIDNPDDE